MVSFAAEPDQVFLGIMHSGQKKCYNLNQCSSLTVNSGKTFLSGESQRNVGLGLAAGIRINVLPQKNWNPSLVIMPGVIYSSKTTSRYDDYGPSGISGTLCFAVSNAFHRKHMVSIGLNSGANIFAAYLKYGFWFEER